MDSDLQSNIGIAYVVVMYHFQWMMTGLFFRDMHQKLNRIAKLLAPDRNYVTNWHYIIGFIICGSSGDIYEVEIYWIITDIQASSDMACWNDDEDSYSHA